MEHKTYYSAIAQHGVTDVSITYSIKSYTLYIQVNKIFCDHLFDCTTKIEGYVLELQKSLNEIGLMTQITTQVDFYFIFKRESQGSQSTALKKCVIWKS